ncbi:MAG: HlyD family secretion protein [Crocinitomicaceae bacterium]|nr:HlyD family secretion protein [Crocinitomicaceae bacterium]
MLNISENSITEYLDKSKYGTLVKVESKRTSKVLRRLIYMFFGLSILILLLPWTQNIRSYGTVSTLRPNQRPQSLNTVIAGQVEEWYVQEGDYVSKGDTILKIKEVKDAYFDDQLLPRTENQVNLKKESVVAYGDKIKTQEEQMVILAEQRDLKLEQAKIKLQQATLKVQNDSISFTAMQVQAINAERQYRRTDSLYALGLKSLTQVEQKRLKFQESLSKETEANNKWLNSQNELIALQIEISNIKTKFNADYNKLLADKLSTQSLKLDTETSVVKLENQYSNYVYRNGLYYITAPQDGYITRTSSTGIGETLKEGQEILTLMPRNYDLAVEVFVEPIDLPLIKLGEKVRIQFDGWPAIVFSGWPNASHGTYGGKIYAIDQFISANGKYRVLIEPDPDDYPWPEALRYGSGTSTMILLNDVPIWYELWRRINGFPPDYYKGLETETPKKK